jgi:hypothetical protein
MRHHAKGETPIYPKVTACWRAEVNKHVFEGRISLAATGSHVDPICRVPVISLDASLN